MGKVDDSDDGPSLLTVTSSHNPHVLGSKLGSFHSNHHYGKNNNSELFTHPRHSPHSSSPAHDYTKEINRVDHKSTTSESEEVGTNGGTIEAKVGLINLRKNRSFQNYESGAAAVLAGDKSPIHC